MNKFEFINIKKAEVNNYYQHILEYYYHYSMIIIIYIYRYGWNCHAYILMPIFFRLLYHSIPSSNYYYHESVCI